MGVPTNCESPGPHAVGTEDESRYAQGNGGGAGFEVKGTVQLLGS
jgi:hypothetical protein